MANSFNNDFWNKRADEVTEQNAEIKETILNDVSDKGTAKKSEARPSTTMKGSKRVVMTLPMGESDRELIREAAMIRGMSMADLMRDALRKYCQNIVNENK